MPVFPSVEWMQAFRDELVGHPDLDELAEQLDGVYRFEILPYGPLAREHAYALELHPSQDGTRDSVRLLDPPPAAGEATLTMTADYRYWRQLIQGQLDIVFALALRRIRVQGDLGRLTKRVSSAQGLIEALRAVETEWLD